MTGNRLLIIELDCHSATATQSSGSLKCCCVPSRIKIWICNMPPHTRTKLIHYTIGDQIDSGLTGLKYGTEDVFHSYSMTNISALSIENIFAGHKLFQKEN